MNSLGQRIAEGRQAEIYRWGETQVVKLYRNAVSLDVAEYEASITRAVHATGLPVPAVGEIVEVDDRVGLVLHDYRLKFILRNLNENSS